MFSLVPSLRPPGSAAAGFSLAVVLMPIRPPIHRPLGHSAKTGAWSTTTTSRHERGYGNAWRDLRLLVLAEEPLCRACRADGRVTAATEVDHVVPKSRGGTDERSNVQPLCRRHHTEKTMTERNG